jgi:hypothetical protein
MSISPYQVLSNYVLGPKGNCKIVTSAALCSVFRKASEGVKRGIVKTNWDLVDDVQSDVSLPANGLEAVSPYQ